MTGKSLEKILFHAPFAAGILLVAGGWIWAWLALGGGQGPFILHFSDYTGINQIGSMADIHGLGATGAMIVLVNFFVASSLRTKDPLWSKLMGATALFLAALLFTALAAIISVNQ